MILILYQKDLINGSWKRISKFKPQIIEKSRLSSIKKKEQSKYPGHDIFFRYIEIPNDVAVDTDTLKNIIKEVKN